MDLSEAQEQVDAWIRQHGGCWDKFQILARLSEELGEVSAALQRIEGLRPRQVDRWTCWTTTIPPRSQSPATARPTRAATSTT